MPEITTETTFKEFIASFSPAIMPPDDPRTREMYEEAMIQAAAFARITSIPPCPSWCQAGDGHRYGDLEFDELGFRRDHLRHFGRCVSVMQTEANRENVVTIGETNIWIDLPPQSEELNGDTAREVAADLTAAADLYDEIMAVQR